MNRKHRVAAAFAAAATTYDSAAEAQDRAAAALAARVLAAGLPPSPRVLEIGCGTGLLTRRLLPVLGGRWLVTDLAEAMVAAAREALPGAAAEFRVMDGEHPNAPPGGFDLVVSNLAAQWFGDLGAALRALRRCLAPNGRMMLTTLGAGSFAEWRAAHSGLGLACGTQAYPAAEQLADMLDPGARVIAEPIAVRYADGRAFVGALKAIGAATPAPGHRPLKPGELKRVLAALGAPATITYEVLTVDSVA